MGLGKVLRVTGTRGETQKWHHSATSKAKQSWAEVAKPSGLSKSSLQPPAKANGPRAAKLSVWRKMQHQAQSYPGGPAQPTLADKVHAAPTRGSSRTGELGTNLLLQTAPERLQAGAKPRQGPLCLVAQWLLSLGPLAAQKQHHRHQCHIAPRNLEALTLLQMHKRPVLVFANEPNHVLTMDCWVCCTQWVTSCHSVQGLVVCHISGLPSACLSVMADPRSGTIMSLWTKGMSLALLLSGDRSGCFSTCSSHEPFCLIHHVNYFETRLFSDHVFSL